MRTNCSTCASRRPCRWPELTPPLLCRRYAVIAVVGLFRCKSFAHAIQIFLLCLAVADFLLLTVVRWSHGFLFKCVNVWQRLWARSSIRSLEFVSVHLPYIASLSDIADNKRKTDLIAWLKMALSFGMLWLQRAA